MTEMDDKLIGWLHLIATLGDSDLVMQFNEENKTRLAQLVTVCIPSQTVPVDLEPLEFACWIHELRNSERDWNRALGTALLQAEDVYTNGDQIAALQLLQEFATQCPWLPLQKIAEGEARRLSKR